MQFDRTKLRALILYTCGKCKPSQLGAVKLHKVLYFTDMLHYAHVGNSVTGASYKKRPFGPTCDQLLPALQDLHRSGAIRIRDVDYFGFKKKEYEAVASPEIDRLNKTEVDLLDEVIEFVCSNNTAKTISEYSHNRAWEMAEFGETLPYNSVFQIFPTQVSQDAMDWAAKEVDSLEAEESSANAVGGVSFADFRVRVLEARRAR
jgi:Protein of unknown function (DUF4065)